MCVCVCAVSLLHRCQSLAQGQKLAHSIMMFGPQGCYTITANENYKSQNALPSQDRAFIEGC